MHQFEAKNGLFDVGQFFGFDNELSGKTGLIQMFPKQSRLQHARSTSIDLKPSSYPFNRVL